MHPVDADRSPQRTLDAVHRDTGDRILKITRCRTGSQWRLLRTVVTWSRRRAPDTRRAAYFALTVAVSSKRQLFQLIWHYSSPVGSVRMLTPETSKHPLLWTAGPCAADVHVGGRIKHDR